MKMHQAFILTGITLLLGALFMHAWVTPVELNEGSSPYSNGASMMKGDSFVIKMTVKNETTVRLVLYDEDNVIISAESIVLAAGQSTTKTLEMKEAGYYSYEVDAKGVATTLDLDITRKMKIDLLPYPIGAALLAFGIYQRQHDEADDEVAETILDAQLDV